MLFLLILIMFIHLISEINFLLCIPANIIIIGASSPLPAIIKSDTIYIVKDKLKVEKYKQLLKGDFIF